MLFNLNHLNIGDKDEDCFLPSQRELHWDAQYPSKQMLDQS